ncbi:hypothetical protein [Streptomyces cadmiisoli]|uniref:Secreted protein n=1 Tax=Streptomyces cadmiisoli TaxID=2184053 RepID=A0A2Z4J2P8_9ACTN|nr:hypothetical protein [Streptomyces cadmiisoli]AWW39511.1 hypothetical protein DN051_24985 [Streptomyces cadmiisoli]
MRALPARRLASGALCAALLVGITGPAAAAADSADERSRTTSADAPLPGADALRTQIGRLRALGVELAPVTDLLNAALGADGTRMSDAEAKRLGRAAKDALAEAAAKAPAIPLTPPASVLGTGVLLVPLPAPAATEPEAEAALRADLVGDLLDALGKAVDGLLAAVTAGDVDAALVSLDDLLKELKALLDALLGGLTPAQTLPSPAPAASEPPAPAVTLPGVTMTQTMLLSTS